MKLNSISIKLFSIMVGAFFCSTVSILLIADSKLTRIINTSKNALYKEKVDTIWSVLYQNNERLQKTGLVEAYLEDFKKSTLKELRHTYYNLPGLNIYPFIIDTEGNIIMHPTLPENTAPPGSVKIVKRMLVSDRGDFDAVYKGGIKYYIFRNFPEWQWIIGYAVPLETKYAEARTFRNLLIIIMTGVTLSILLLLVPVIARFTKPITRLTSAAKAMAEGDLDKEIRITGNDEIGTLANSFQDMRAAIRQTIHELEQENAERKKAEKALANEIEQLDVTLKSIGDGVVTTDKDGRIILMNTVAGKLTGWENKEVTGRALKDVLILVDQQTGEPTDNLVEKILAGGTTPPTEGHVTLTAANGRESIIAINGAPIRDALNNSIGVVLVFRDITEQIEIEQELLKSRKLESIGVLAGGIAHDFNNILTVILGNINLALQDEILSEKIRNRLINVEKASHRAKDLTQQLLTFSRGGAPVKAVSSLANIIKDSAEFVLHGSNAACRFDIPEDLWPADIDKGQISQVIQNIVINGSEAMSGGGIITIACSNVVGGDNTHAVLANGQKYIGISIADSGEGISALNIDKIFDPYFSTKPNGNGLGLAICHSIVSKHNGHISVKSDLGSGTTFTVYLPAAEQRQVDDEKKTVAAPGSMQATVMIMDDEELVREMVEMMLVKMGHIPVPAVDGNEAVHLYKQHKESDTPIDLVIMDLTIPGAMGGKETVKELLAFDRQTKAIVSSGYSNDPVMANPCKYGFKAAISKPYSYEKLAEVIDGTLRENPE